MNDTWSEEKLEERVKELLLENPGMDSYDLYREVAGIEFEEMHRFCQKLWEEDKVEVYEEE